MSMRGRYTEARERWALLTLYGRFEHLIILILTALIAVVIALATWNLALWVLFDMLFSSSLNPLSAETFQVVFGMVFTVIIALEFKRSLLVVAERNDSVVQVRTVILIALLAIVRKLIILDLGKTDAQQLFALAAAILALGGVYWLVRYQDARQRA
jgi:uncharacterized membrane protein (DUF373 family)